MAGHSTTVEPVLWGDRYQRSLIIDTAVRGLLAVALYVAFPPFSDIHRLWERANGLNLSWPAGALEYPPISALYLAPLGVLPSSRWAVAVNGLVMVVAAVGITWVLLRVARWSRSGDADVRLWVASPALLLFLPINWDALVTVMALAGVVALYRSRPALSGFLSSLGTAFKVFPGVLVLPVLPLIDGWRRRVVFLATGFGVLVVSYLTYALVDPAGWRFHLDFASTRVDTESTIWGVLDTMGIGLSNDAVNLLSTFSVALALLLLTLWVARFRPSFAEVAVLAITAVLVLNKVFKPQYVIWVLPFYAWIRSDRIKVRLVEAAAIVAFVVVYFDVPKWINPIETTVRVTLLIWLAYEVVKKRTTTQIT
jgi:hypothetical protein